MKHLNLVTICLILAIGLMVVNDAGAGKIKKPPKGSRTDKTEEETAPHRFDDFPTMDFVGGTLTQDAHTGWKIGNTPLYIKDGCVITMDGVEEQGWLEEGREAVVMGARVGEAISAWSIRVAQPAYKAVGMSQSQERKVPGPNGNVGQITGRVE